MPADSGERPRATPPAGGAFDAIGLFLIMRVSLGLVAGYVWFRGGLPGPCHFELARDGWLTVPPLADQGPAFPLLGVWQRWDACWYGKIATFGYEPGTLSVNFWPLFPMLTGALARVLDGSVALAGMLIAGVSYVAAMTGLYRLIGRDFDARTARRVVILISIFPSAFFLFAPFTEALFLALAVWTIAMARERRWLLAGALGLLAALTRIQGLFLVLPIGWEALAAGGFTAWRPRPAMPFQARDIGAMLRGGVAALGPVLGFVGFLAYANAVVGRTPLDTQGAWGGVDFHPPWDVAAAAWRWTLERHDPLQALNLTLLVLFGVLLVAGIRRLPIAYLLFAIPQLVLLATRIQPTPLTSTNRYLLVIFPAFVVVALIPWRPVRLAWAITSALFLALLVQSFLVGEYVA